MVIARVKARKEIQTSQEKNKIRVNDSRRRVEFQVGDRVLLRMKHLKTSKDGKLKPKYSGPYVVLKRLSPLTYRLTKTKGSYKSSVVHVKRLKLYRRRETETERVVETSSGTEADEEDNRPDSGNRSVLERVKRTGRRSRRTNSLDKTKKRDTKAPKSQGFCVLFVPLT